MNKNSGQTLYYFLVFVLLLIISFAMMLNIAKLIRDRMIMQNEIDNIALSIANHKARTMNFVGACNYLIGSLLGLGTKPELIQIPTYTTEAVAAFPYGDYRGASGNQALDRDVAFLKNAVEAIQKAQDAALISHLVYQNALMAKYAGGDHKLIIFPTALATKENAQKYFGLKRNSKGIKYLKTVNNQTSPLPHIVYNPFPLKDVLDKLGSALASTLKKVGIDPEEKIMNVLNLPGSALKEKVHAESEYSWYITDENFSDQKIQAALIKIPKDEDKPLFAKLLGIDFPSISAFSAAAIYNTQGTMFPSEESDIIGKTDTEVLLLGITAAQYGIFSAEMLSKDPTPYKVLSIVTLAYLAVRVLERTVKYQGGEGNSAETSPIAAYKEAKFGGWNAHLIPYKTRDSVDN